MSKWAFCMLIVHLWRTVGTDTDNVPVMPEASEIVV